LFDSRVESDYYRFLLQEKEDGRIREIELQPTFEIIPRFKHKNRVIRKTLYIADFRVIDSAGTETIIDVKGGAVTREFALKKKLFHLHYPDQTLKIVRKEKGEWVESL
jgi:hypothetical protein